MDFTTIRLLRAAAAVALVWAASAPGAAADVINRIVATVDGAPITQLELEQFAARSVRARQLASEDRDALLDALITEHIIQKEVSEQGVSVGDEEIDRYIDGIKQRNRITDEQLRAALAQQGIDWERYRTQIREDLQRVQLINREIRGKVNVTPEEVQRYYEAHIDEYATSEGMAVSHILIRLAPDASSEEVEAAMGRANDIHARLSKGADFAEVARAESEDPASARSGGSLGTFKKGEMIEEIEKAVSDLEPGKFSKPFRTKLGVHIARLDEKSAASHQPLESLAAEIKEKLYAAALEERYARWLREDLRQRHHVEILP